MSHITKELFDLAMISPGTDFNKKFLYIGVLYRIIYTDNETDLEFKFWMTRIIQHNVLFNI